MKIINLYILFVCLTNAYCFGQNSNFEKKDSLVVINGDTAIVNEFSSTKKSGLFMGQGSTSINGKDILLINIFQKENNVQHGMDILYNENNQLRQLMYVQKEYPKASDSLRSPFTLQSELICYEGIVINGSMVENRIMAFSIFDKETKIKTSFFLDKHSRISIRIFFDKDEKPCRIIFFTKKMKIKGDYRIEELDLKNDYLKFRYWRNKF